MMQAASTSETSVNFYRTTRRNNTEDSHLHTHRLEELKFHNFKQFLEMYVKINVYNAEEHLCIFHFYKGCVWDVEVNVENALEESMCVYVCMCLYIWPDASSFYIHFMHFV
jgi:hypothetical protein